jgi:phosphatidylserine decarboxylase
MRIPLVFRYAAREIALFVFLPLALAGFAAALGYPLLAILPFLLGLFSINFFRDPDRPLPGGAETLVSPADGTVTDVVELDEPLYLKERAVRIGIFLSVFDVHVNRSPSDGRVEWIEYRPGKFLDARKKECSTENEANWIGILGEGRGAPLRLAVKQISGAIARRIVCPLRPGDAVSRGVRIGMIKFGSRTELYIPVSARATILVCPGKKVRGGGTAVARLGD